MVKQEAKKARQESGFFIFAIGKISLVHIFLTKFLIEKPDLTLVEYFYSFSDIEQLFPISFVVNNLGEIQQFSTELGNRVSSLQEKGSFNQLFKLKNNAYFLFSFDFYRLNRGKEFVFEGVWDKKEYCFVVLFSPQSQTMLFSARTLYPTLIQQVSLVEHYKSLATFPEDNPNPIVRLNYYGDVLYGNKAATATFTNFVELLTHHEDLNKSFKKVVTEKISIKTEFNYYGKVFSVQIVAHKERDYINVFMMDITQEKMSQKMIQEERAQKVMASKLSTLGEMASGVAHEINNPLTVMIGRMDLMKKLLSSPDLNTVKETLEKSLDVIARSSKRISYIIKGLRNFSRDGDKDPFDLVKVEQIIDDVLMLTSEKLKQSNVNLKIDVLPGLEFQCRSVQIEQVIVNLIHNSFDAIEKLEDKWISLFVTLEGSNVVFEVMDSGKGISKELQDKILQPFFTTKDVGKGTGLGLSISLGLIESHGGKLFYKEGSGNTCFRFEFPRYQGIYLKSA